MPFANGMPNAAVLPDPVRDCTIRSRPAMMSGSVLVCTIIGSEKPMSSSARNTSARSPSSAKVGPLSLAGTSGAPAGAAAPSRFAGGGSGSEGFTSVTFSIMGCVS